MSTLALVHPTDLLTVELRESLDRRRDLWEQILLFSKDSDEIGTLTEVRGAAAMVQKLERNSLDGIDVAFFGGSIHANRPLIAALPESTAAVVLSPDAAADDGYPIVAGVNLDRAHRLSPMLSPHPATVVLAHLLCPLSDFEPRLAAATVLQPLSFIGKNAIDEVFEQTRSLLSFNPDPPREVFPMQMVYNVVPAQAPVSLEDQLRTVLDNDLQLSIHLVQAGIFHSFSTSLYIELAADPGLEAVNKALGQHPMNELARAPQQLGPVAAAASDKVLVGATEAVSGGSQKGGYRVWAAMDNLTCGGALNAIQILEAISHQATH